MSTRRMHEEGPTVTSSIAGIAVLQNRIVWGGDTHQLCGIYTKC